jgi:hypothetical protein
MTEQDMISEILRVELLITRAVINDKHQATDDDEYQPLRDKINGYRKQLGIK